MLIVFLCLALWTWPPAIVGAPIPTYGPSEVPSNFWTQKQRPQYRCHCSDHWATVVEHYPSAAVTREHYASSAVTREPDYPSAAVTREHYASSAVTREHYASSAVTREHYASSAVTREHYASSAVTRELDYPSAAVTEQADPWSAVDNWTGRYQERPAAVDYRPTDKTISATAYDHCYDKAEGEEIDDDNISVHSFLPIILIAMFSLVYPILYCFCNSRKQKDE